METQILFKKQTFFFPNLYKLHNVYILMEFYLILLRRVYPQGPLDLTIVMWSAPNVALLPLQYGLITLAPCNDLSRMSSGTIHAQNFKL